MTTPAFDEALSRRTTMEALLDARARFGGSKEALEDPERTPLTYDRLVLGALILGKKIARGDEKGKRVGVLLPSVNGVAVTVFGLWFHGLVPVLLNFTAGARNLVSACETAEIERIITSRRFIDTAKLDDVVAALGKGREIVYLEDVRKEIGTFDKIVGLVKSKFARMIAKRACNTPDDPAIVLFTSGSEGVPKGVVLSHANIVANACQIWQHADGMLTSADVACNPLPVFHSFGLTAGLLVGLFNGMKVVMYPSPLHYKQVPKLIRETGASLLFATDTFLVGYARAAEEGELASLRLVVTGAEKVKDSTRDLWAPMGTTILEGYGCTECAPVLSCNVPPTNKRGTVGGLLPGIAARLEPVEGIHEGGRLVVKGPNVMLGYMLAGMPRQIQPPQDGWYDTGDIVDFDADGFIVIKGRAKRFAKLGGEMVSLAAVETVASDLWPGATHVGVALPDKRKGEQVVLVTDTPEADRQDFLDYAKRNGIPELFVPRAILVVNAIPVLGSGKIDYAGTTELVKTMRSLI